MKTFGLLECVNHGNKELAEVEAPNKTEAIKKLQQHSPVTLDEHGYCKVGDTSWIVAENFNPYEFGNPQLGYIRTKPMK